MSKQTEANERIGRNVYANVDANPDGGGWKIRGDGKRLHIMIDLTGDANETAQGHNLATTPGKLGARIALPNGKVVHALSRTMFFPKYQGWDSGRGGSATGENPLW